MNLFMSPGNGNNFVPHPVSCSQFPTGLSMPRCEQMAAVGT